MQKADLFRQAQAVREAQKQAEHAPVRAVSTIPIDGIEWFGCKSSWTQEKVAAAALIEAKFLSYLPTIKTKIYRQRPFRAVEVVRPLFATYLFVGMRPNDRRFYDARRAKGVVALLGVVGYPLRIPGKVLRDIDLAIQRGVFDAPVPINLFAEDDHVRILGGPFSSFHGTVTKVLPDDTVRILVTLFGRTTSLRMEACQLEKVAI